MDRGKSERLTELIFWAVVVAIYAAIVARHFYGMDPVPFISWGRTVVGSVFAILAGMVFLLNVYLHIIVPWLYKRRHGSTQDYSSASGLPVLCGVFALFAGMLLPPSMVMGIVLLIIFSIDPLGLPAALYVFLRQSRSE